MDSTRLPEIYIIDEQPKIIGRGGSTTAIKYSDDEVLLVPTTLDKNWGSIRYYEDIWQEKLQEIGIMCQTSRYITVLYKGLILEVPINRSFNSYLRENIYIIEPKIGNMKWNQFSNDTSELFFKNTETMYNVNVWQDMLDPVINDINTLISHNILIPCYYDTLNYAVLVDQGNIKIKLFLFDFNRKPIEQTFGSYPSKHFLVKVLDFAVWLLLGDKRKLELTEVQKAFIEYLGEQYCITDTIERSKEVTETFEEWYGITI